MFPEESLQIPQELMLFSNLIHFQNNFEYRDETDSHHLYSKRCPHNYPS